jgi:tRNA 5-methylaminomethyl-2-thiouridine biosynthesis bifunctional protein
MLNWTPNKTPIHTGFSDKYYAEEGGLDEARYVYVGQNNLEERFTQSETFVVSELGFGTGLNFLATLQAWKRARKRPSQILHYISTELYPLESAAIREALSPWTSLDIEREEFLRVYSPVIRNLALNQDFERSPAKGIHRFNLGHGVFLTLLIGDALQMLKQVQFKSDAWFLDGFSPRKNPAMWSLDLFQDVVRLSNPGATFATFTAAGHVRRNLQSVGFDVQKFEGFGRKKEMLKGRLRLADSISPKNKKKRALIIGAGLAGSSTAFELAERNWDVVIVDRHAQAASESSGNPWGMYYPLLTKHRSALSEFSLQAYDYLLRRLHANTTNETSTLEALHTHGILQLKRRDKDFDRYTSAMEWVEPAAALMTRLSPDDASKLAGIRLNEEGVFFPQAGCLQPADFCRTQINAHSKIRFVPHVEVNTSNLQWESLSRTWILQTPQEAIEADTVIFCNASGAKQFPWSSHLKLGVNRGQLCEVKASASSSKLKTILAGDFYLTPDNQGQHLLGATYDRENLDLVVKESDNLDLISRTHLASPDLDLIPESIVSSRTAHRTSTVTKLPIVGILDSAPGPVAVNIGHGSRGIVYAPLSSQILADLLSDMPMAASLSMLEMLKPQL